MNAKATRRFAGILVATCVVGLGFGGLAAADDGTSAAGIQAITQASDDVTLSFDRPGRIVELPAKEGDPVTAGQMVAKQDDTEEQAALALAKLTADDDTTIKAEQAVLEQKKVDYENLKNAHAGSHYEIDQARLEVTVEEAKVKLQQFQQTQNQYKYEQTKAATEKTKLFSPIAGVVQELKVHVGESVDSQNMKVIRIVQLDPLWVDVPVPFAMAERLKVDDPAEVTLSNKEVRPARVIHLASVGSSAGGSLLVRILVKNPNQRKAGEQVSVTFPTAGKVASVDQP